MRKFIMPVLLGGVLIWLMFFRQVDVPPKTLHWQQFLALGTLVEVTVRTPDEVAANKATLAVEAQLAEVNDDWHAWQDSRLADINQQLASTGRARIPADMQPRIHRAQQLAQASDDRFDPAIGRLVALWGFHDDQLDLDAAPAPDDIQQWRETHLPFSQWQWQGDELIGNTQGWLDFGAFAKGSALQLAAQTLAEQGIEHALINAGGDLLALGYAQDPQGKQRPWVIGIRNPRPNAGPQSNMLAKLNVAAGEAMFTSGDYERYFMDDGRRYHHVIDPSSGYPTQGVTSVTVLAQDAELADAAATAIMVAGPGVWPAVAAQLGVQDVLLYTESGVAELTASMAERLSFIVQPEAIKILALPAAPQ